MIFSSEAKDFTCFYITILFQIALSGLNWSDEAASTAADDDQIRVETCTDPCGLNRSDEAASTAADDDQINIPIEDVL